MSSSSFFFFFLLSCPSPSDRGTTGWIRKFSAVLNIKQAAARRLNKQATCFCKGWICSSFLTFPASQRRLVLRPPYQSRLGARPCSISGSLPKTLSVHHHTEQQLYINSYLLVPEVHKFIKTKCGMGESQGGEEQMNPNGAGQTFCFFFFSTKGKKGNQNAPSLTKVVPYYTLMYAHKHSLARTHAHTQTQSHAPSIVIRGKNMIVIFLQLLLWECPSFVCHGGEHRIKEFS